MIRNAILLAAALVPAVAHAEFRVARPEEIRPATTKRVAKPMPKTTVAAPVVVQTRLSIDDMLGKINGVYMNGLRRCYTKALMNDPTIAGKLTLTFTVEPNGRINPDVAGAPQMQQCVASQARRWRFEIPENTKLATEETYRVSLVLGAN